MADTWDNAEMGGPVGEVEESQPQQIQEKKINKKKLAEQPNGKMLQIFMRDPVTRAMVPCTEIKDVPRDVATICSDYIYKKIVSQGEPYLVLDNSLGLAPYKFVFDWIKTCGQEQNVASAPEIKDLINDETGMKPFIDAMVVANKLQISHASFGKFMVRKLLPLARDHLIDLETVRRAYDTGDDVFNELDIREVCVKSIFEHWYSWKLDGDDEAKVDYMCTLYDMRQDIPVLNDELNKAYEDKNQWLKDMRKKRQEARDQENNDEAAAGTGAGDGNDGWADQNTGATGGGDDSWMNQAAGTSGGGDDWMNNDTAATGATAEWAAEPDTGGAKGGNDWAGGAGDSTTNDFGSGGGGGSWADEMQDGVGQAAQSFNPAPIAAGNAW
ncbi:hypothetical protein OHC33_007151 [Knufia fluminis]|uniref:Uncharacterized protein n=1 Tax=Knufia fluminis TaxID=191047 RepID=A0AAN8ECB0_9EURO|nr:hypothetical protein OHC33_007151 [Knufia fluminis]